MLVGEVASCVEDDSAKEGKEGNSEADKSANISSVKDLPGLPGKDLTAR